MINALGTMQGIGAGFGASAAGQFAPSIAPAAIPGAQTSFAAALGDMASRAVGSLHKAEQVSIQALQGEAQTRDVVDAVMSAEQSLQAAVAIRDKIVSSYLEISRMAI